MRILSLAIACVACMPQSVVVKPRTVAGLGGVRGVITDATSGAPLVNAYVLLAVTTTDTKKTHTWATLSDVDGTFELVNLPPVDYQLVVEKGGYRVAAPAPLVVTANDDLVLHIQLRAGTGPGDQTTLGNVIEPPVKISGPDPAYTFKALEDGVQGTMLLKCIITVEGDVRNCRIRKGLRHMDAAAIRALEARKYRPAHRGGHPIDVDYTFRINLRLP